jgi:F-type H+-transporting ATPase subunit epsilon
VPHLHLKVVSPERTLLDEDAEEVILQAKTGQIAILPNHMPMVTELANGDIVVRKNGHDEVSLIYGGFVYVKEGSNVLILADGAEHLAELNEAEILEARKEALVAIENAKGNETALAVSEAQLARITTQLRSLHRHTGLQKYRRGKEDQKNL